MPKDTSKEQQKFLKDFGEILAKQVEAQSFGASEEKFVDQAALGFARYLRAARLNAGSSPSELAIKASLPKAEIYALERGLISSKDIKVESLRALASALGEQIRIFGLLLGRHIPAPAIPAVQVARSNQDWLGELRGDRGRPQQFAAHRELAGILYKKAYSYLKIKQAQSNPHILTTFAPQQLADLAQEYVQETLEKLACNSYALFSQFKGDSSFLSWVTNMVSHHIARELRESFDLSLENAEAWTSRTPTSIEMSER